MAFLTILVSFNAALIAFSDIINTLFAIASISARYIAAPAWSPFRELHLHQVFIHPIAWSLALDLALYHLLPVSYFGKMPVDELYC